MVNLFLYQCSFCGWSRFKEDELVIGPEVSICQYCTEVAAKYFHLLKDNSE